MLDTDYTSGKSGFRVFSIFAIGYLAFSAMAKPSIAASDIADFWVPIAEIILTGNWIEIFSHRHLAFNLEFPNPSLVFVLLQTIPIALAKCMGIDPAMGLFQTILLCVFDVLAARELSLLAAEIKKGETDWMPGILYLTGFTTAFSTLGMAHQEGISLFLCFSFIRNILMDKKKSSIVWGALLFLTKTSNILLLIPIATWLLIKDYRQAMKIFLPISMIILLVLSPYLIFRFEDTWYSIVKFESMRIILGVTPIKFFQETMFELHVIRYSSLLLVLISVAISLISFAYYRVPLNSPLGLWALMCSALLIPFFAKWVYIHYLQVGFGMILLWNELISNSRNRFIFPLSFLGAAYILQGIRMPEIFDAVSPAILLRSTGWLIFAVVFLAVSLRFSKRQETNIKICSDDSL